MVQCHLCQVWVHYDCVGEKEDDIIGIWCCQSCRNISRGVNSLLEKVSSLELTIKALQENNSQLVRLVEEQSNAASELREENVALKEQTASLREELSCASSQKTVADELVEVTTELARLREVVEARPTHPKVRDNPDPHPEKNPPCHRRPLTRYY